MTMLPGDYPLAQYQGDYFETPPLQIGVEVPAEDPEDDPVFTPKDLTDCTFEAVFKYRRASSTVVAEYEVEILDALQGTLKVKMQPEESVKLRRHGVWDLEITDADGRPNTWLTGVVTVTREVTP